MNLFSALLRVIALLACAQLTLPAIALADEEEPRMNFGSGYYEAPVISTLSVSCRNWYWILALTASRWDRCCR